MDGFGTCDDRGVGDAAEREKERDTVLWFLAGIVLVGATLRFTELGDQGLWADEGFTG